jgi:hypothetical protein
MESMAPGKLGKVLQFVSREGSLLDLGAYKMDR